MSRAKGIVGAFGPLGETGQTTLLPQRAHTVAAARQDLVRIALMPHVPDQLVMRCVENRMQGHRQLDHTQR